MKTQTLSLATGAMVCALFTACQPAFATTFLTGGFAAGTNAILGQTGNPGTLSDPQSATTNATVGTAASVGSSSSVSGPEGTVKTHANASGIWNTADSGSFKINWGWENSVNGIYAQALTNEVPANWFYSFVASGDGVFNVSGSVAGFGSLFALHPVYFTGSNGFSSIGGNVSDPNGSGSLSFGVLSGQTYSINAFNFGNISSDFLQGAGSAESAFDWNIKYNNVSAVPLPGALPLLALGLGALGVTRRVRRKKTG